MLTSLLIFVVAFLFTLRGRARRFAEMEMPLARAGTPA
jgi:hypothetical protein